MARLHPDVHIRRLDGRSINGDIDYSCFMLWVSIEHPAQNEALSTEI